MSLDCASPEPPVGGIMIDFYTKAFVKHDAKHVRRAASGIPALAGIQPALGSSNVFRYSIPAMEIDARNSFRRFHAAVLGE